MQDVISLPPRQDSEEDMKLRDDDKAWLSGEISRQIAESLEEFRPKGWKKLIFVLRELGPLGTSITIIVGLLALTAGSLYQSFAHVKEESDFQTHTNDRLTLIEKSLKELDSDFKTVQLKQLSNDPTNSQNIASAKGLLDQAIARNTPITQQVIEESGLKFVEASTKSSAAWPVALSFLTYRSMLNAPSLQLLPTPQPSMVTTHYYVEFPAGEVGPTFSVPLGNVPKEQSAEFVTKGHDLNKANTIGNQYVFATGGAAILDETKLKNVVFIGVHIFYNGGPLSMENVYFVNCVFDIKQQPKGEEFAKILLGPNKSVAFNAS